MPVLKCGSDMGWADVDQLHAEALARQPGRVYAGAAADAEHYFAVIHRYVTAGVAQCRGFESGIKIYRDTVLEIPRTDPVGITRSRICPIA
jgi:hypothetical protein